MDFTQTLGLTQRFTTYYDKHMPGCARFLRDAVAHWAK